MVRISTLVLFITLHLTGNSQQKYWVVFNDKDTSDFHAESYFTAAALTKIEQRGNKIDFYDYPVKPENVESIITAGAKVLQESCWLNAVAVKATNTELDKIACLEGVKSIHPIVTEKHISSYDTSLKDNQHNLLKNQLAVFEPEYFFKNGINGSGVTIAFFDAGFPNVDESPVFKHLFENGQIKGTYDFVTGKEFVYHAGSHGTSTLSCAAGIVDGKKIGLATGANYLLARTEMSVREPFSEEENWLAAVEWAYRNGADIISSSLGYTYKRYYPTEMDGHSTFVAQAARIAARKGILVVNSAGNEGSSNWKFIGTPADVDSVLSVGGISPDTHLRINFSSFGPNAKQQLKPNVTAYGKVVAAGKSGMEVTFGTSFSCPLVSGFAACVWQMFPDKSNMEIMELIQQSAHLYPYFDYAHGYGIPKASYFQHDEIPENQASLKVADGDLYVNIDTNTLENEPGEYLYYHLENELGYLDWYKVVEVNDPEIFITKLSDVKDSDIIRIKYKQTNLTYKR